MKTVVLLVFALAAVLIIGSAFAVPPGKTVEYAGGAMGKVVFDGKFHADKGLKCADCHPTLFAMKKNGTEIKAPHEAGKLCWSCHDGSKAFNLTECARCHTK